MKIFAVLCILAGSAGVLSGIMVSPEFALEHLSVDSNISPDRFEMLRLLRLYSVLLGIFLVIISIFLIKFPDNIRRISVHPSGTLGILIIVWIIIAFINFLMKQTGFDTGAPNFFPFSEFYGPRIHLLGLPYSMLFLIAFFISLKYIEHFNAFYVWLAGLILIVLGNLAQGGVAEAFYKPVTAPFYYQDVAYYQQYYHEAIKITDWREWLGTFNENQGVLLKHTRTHPPFAILLHYFIIKISENHLPFIAVLFVLLSSLSIIIIFAIMRELGLSKQYSVQFALLFSVVPAYNIYSAVSLDGIIISFAAAVLLGVVMLIMRGMSLPGILFFIAGMLLMNLFTFTGLFLLGTAGIISLKDYLANKNKSMLIVFMAGLFIMVSANFFMMYFYGYDHVRAFFTAVSLEPKSITPLKYVMTRLENLAMFAIFLSFGVCSMLLRPNLLRMKIFDLHDRINTIFLAGILPILFFLLIGGLYTGEIARIFLFIYPFFFLLLRKIDASLLRFLVIASGLQTIIMQTFGGYFW